MLRTSNTNTAGDRPRHWRDAHFSILSEFILKSSTPGGAAVFEHDLVISFTPLYRAIDMGPGDAVTLQLRRRYAAMLAEGPAGYQPMANSVKTRGQNDNSGNQKQ
jgi:hypothetical protein